MAGDIQPDALPLIAAKTLPSALHLPEDALSPTTPSLVLLTSPPEATADPKVVLYRLAPASTDFVWEWSPPPPPVPAPTGKLGGLGLKGKAKAQTNGGKVERVQWSPDGQAIAVVSSHPAASPTLTILSVHSGQPVAPPLPLSRSSGKDGRYTHSSWQSVSLPTEARLEPWALRIIEQLPALPKIEKANIAAAGADGPGSGPSIGGARIGGAGLGGAGGGGGGVFGAKQAMLERERAKEAQRPLSMRDAAPRFPTLLPSPDGLDEADDDSDPKVLALLKGRTACTAKKPSRERGSEGTLSCVSDDTGVCELYLNGCVHLGAVEVGGRVLAITAIPPDPVDGMTRTTSSVRLVAHYIDSSDSLAVRTINVPLPATLGTVVRQSTALRATLEHAFEALQEARNLWDEARRIGKGWLQRLGDVSRPHGVKHSPATQLHLLLITGRPTRSLHDFLASKLNERGLVKWEQAMAAALERLREVGWLSIIPALERSMLLLREMDAWARWPEKFGDYGFDRVGILKAVTAAEAGIRSAAVLQREAEEEERCFKHFGAWLHYELEKVAAQEGSETRPSANFQPTPVSHYIQYCLPPTATSISPYLSFGLASASLASNADLAAVASWLSTMHEKPSSPMDRVAPTFGSNNGLTDTLKRVKQELRGQIDAERLDQAREAQARDSARDEEIAWAIRAPYAGLEDLETSSSTDMTRPTAHFSRAEQVSDLDERPQPASAAASDIAPRSLPALLHTIAQLSGAAFDAAIIRVTGQQSNLGELSVVEPVHQPRAVRTRVVKASDASLWLCTVAISRSSAYFSRQPLAPASAARPMYATCSISPDPSSAGDPVLALAFESDTEMVIVIAEEGIEASRRGAARYLEISLDNLEWSEHPGQHRLRPILTNSVKRVSGAGPGFLLVWLLADLLNLVGIIVLKAAMTQQALAGWYLVADSIMLVQMLAFGHDDLKWRPPQPAKAATRIEARKNKPWYHALTRQFMEFSVWDDIKLLGFCVVGGTAVWGLYLTLGLYNNPDTFAIEIPEGYHPASFWLGLAAISIFTAARIPEILSGRARSKREEKPTHTLGDPLRWFLIFENFFNLAAILTLSTKKEYLLAETPFILGAALPILFDGLMLFAISSWQRRWAKLDTPAARQAKEAEAAEAEELDLLKAEQEDIIIEQRLRILLATVEADLPEVPEDAKPKERRKIEAARRKIQLAQADYRQNESALRAVQQRLQDRKHQRAKARLNTRTSPVSRHAVDEKTEASQ